jgi:aspartyl-tRNA(Asn)/glutamyl-tRNA(Gln) amidotransferase subunit A
MRALYDMSSNLKTIESLFLSYREGTENPRDVTRQFLDNIESKNSYYSAYQSVWSEEAMEAADLATKALAAGHDLGPLHGIPLALKDIFHVEDKVTTCGSVELSQNKSEVTSTVVLRLATAGAIILGKTKTVECAFGGWGTNQIMGTPRNPWDDDLHRIPGGSSSGSAVAVASDLAVCAVGSDTGGSIRLPAAYCGLVGLKLTYGRLPNFGIMPLSQTLDSPGPLTRSVCDALLMFEVMDGRENWKVSRDYKAGDNSFSCLTKGVKGLRIGILSDSERQYCSAETLDAYDEVVRRLVTAGAHVNAFKNPQSYGNLADANGAITAVEAYYNHKNLYENPKKKMDADVRARMLSGKQYAAHDYFGLLQQRIGDIAVFSSQMKDLDVLATPTTIGQAPSIDDVDQNISPGYYTRPFNYLGMCAISVPTGLDSQGLPTSIQIVGCANQEYKVLQAGAAIEKIFGRLGKVVV